VPTLHLTRIPDFGYAIRQAVTALVDEREHAAARARWWPRDPAVPKLTL
jgi:hypothetical protein